MRPRGSIVFRFPHFSRQVKKRHEHDENIKEPSKQESDFLTTQLSAANKQNSALRKQVTDQRDSNALQVHSLRQQKSSLEARVKALSDENRELKNEIDTSATRRQLETAALRMETESLKRQLSDAERRRDIIKSAFKELTQELTSITALHAAAKQELRVVRREREAALDDTCNIQNLLERERTLREVKEYALQKEIIDLRKEQYLSRCAETIKCETPVTPIARRDEEDELINDLQDQHTDVQNPLDTDSLSTEILTPRQGSTKYDVLFSPQIPMTPIRALDDSDYVVNGHGFDSIREPAFAAVEFGRAKLDFKMVLNEPFSAWGSAERPTMMYIGFEYPDGTSLCYVPVRDVRGKYPTPRDSLEQASKDHGLGADYGRDYVQLCLREEVYVALVEQARDLFATRYSTEKVELPRVSYEQLSKDRSRLVSLTASMKPDAHVERKINSCKQKNLVSKELLDKREDIVGDALLAMRFSKAYPNEAGYMLGFKLHGMFVGTG